MVLTLFISLNSTIQFYETVLQTPTLRRAVWLFFIYEAKQPVTLCNDQKDKGSNLGGLGRKSQIMIISYKLHAQPNMANSQTLKATVKSKAKYYSSLAWSMQPCDLCMAFKSQFRCQIISIY